MTRKLQLCSLFSVVLAVLLASAVPLALAADSAAAVQKLIQEIEAAYAANDIERVESLIGLLQAALRSEATQLKASSGKSDTQLQRLDPGPFSFVTSEGIAGTVSIPWYTAYLMNGWGNDSLAGDTSGQIEISIPGALAIDNKIFKVGETTLYATFRSSDSSVVEVDEKGYLRLRRAGVAAITIAIGDARVTALIQVIKLPVSRYMKPTEVIIAMGFPDRTEDAIIYERWHWDKYQDMCLEVYGYEVKIRTKWSGTLR